MTVPVVIGAVFAPTGGSRQHWTVVDLKADAAGTLHAVLRDDTGNDHRTLAVHVLRDRTRFRPVAGADEPR